MDKEIQIEQMNQMLDYLGRNTFTIKWGGESNYKATTLVYNREDSILWKETTKYNHRGKVIESTKKEKAMGGFNGNDMYKAIKEAALEKARKTILGRLMRQELEDNNVYL